jgi:hypothetical protein
MMHAGVVNHRGIRGVRLALVAFAATALLVGCGEGEIQPPVIHDLSEPWQPVPFQLDEAVYLQLEAECREAGIAPGAVLTVIDARGGDIAIVALAGQDSRSDCLVVRERGESMVSGASEMRGEGANEPIGAREIGEPSVATGQQLTGPGADVTVTYAVGQAGTEVGAIDLVLGNGQRVRATSWGRGWYAAWWPGEETTVRYEGIDRNGVPIAPS